MYFFDYFLSISFFVFQRNKSMPYTIKRNSAGSLQRLHFYSLLFPRQPVLFAILWCSILIIGRYYSPFAAQQRASIALSEYNSVDLYS